MGTALRWVGLDIGETSTNVCVCGLEERPQLECVTGSSAAEIAEALARFPLDTVAAVVMESGAEQGLARRLQKLGFPVSILDAGKVHRYLSIRYNKTDGNDARGLAEIARIGRLSNLRVHVRSSECQLLRGELVVRDHLVRQRTAVKNALRSLLRSQGSSVKKITGGKQFRSAVEAEFDAISEEASAHAAEQLRPMLEVCEELTAHIVRADKRIAEFANSHPVTKRFLQIPGVGPICAVSFYTAVEDPYRFHRSENVGAYFGMVPRLKQSGTSLRQSRISKKGNTMTRGHLFMAAGVMLSRAADECAIRDWGRALVVKKGYRNARMAVARKVAVAMLSMWKRDVDFEAYPRALASSGSGEPGLRAKS
jgi:transposase